MSFCASGLISLIVAGSVANGPSMTVTDSPTSKSTTLTCGRPPGRSLLLLGGRREDPDDLVHGQRRGLGGGADEAGDARGVADRAPRLVVQVHPHQDVAGEHLALDLLALAVLDLGDLFGRHLDLEDVVLHVQGLDAALEVGLHLVLVAGVGVHDVPVADGCAARGAAPRPGPRPPRLGSASASSALGAFGGARRPARSSAAPVVGAARRRRPTSRVGAVGLGRRTASSVGARRPRLAGVAGARVVGRRRVRGVGRRGCPASTLDGCRPVVERSSAAGRPSRHWDTISLSVRAGPRGGPGQVRGVGRSAEHPAPAWRSRCPARSRSRP